MIHLWKFYCSKKFQILWPRLWNKFKMSRPKACQVESSARVAQVIVSHFWRNLGHLWEVWGAPALKISGAKHSPPSLSFRWPFGLKFQVLTFSVFLETILQHVCFNTSEILEVIKWYICENSIVIWSLRCWSPDFEIMSKRLDPKLVKLSLVIRPGLSGHFKTFSYILGHLWEV